MSVDDIVLATLINADGIVQLGTAIFQITYDKVKILTDGDEKKIPLLKETETSQPENNIEVRDVERKANTCYSNITSKKRIVGRTWVSRMVSFTGRSEMLRFEVKYQEKNWLGCWKSRQAPYLRINKAEWGTTHVCNLTKPAGSHSSGWIQSAYSVGFAAVGGQCFFGEKMYITNTATGGYAARAYFGYADWGLTNIYECFDGFTCPNAKCP